MDKARFYMGVTMQQEMCRMMSSRFSGVKKEELSAFFVVLRLVRKEYDNSVPNVYKLLLAVLRDCNPSLGCKHMAQIKQYIRLLLESTPELADYLISVLPSIDSQGTSSTLHTLADSPRDTPSATMPSECPKVTLAPDKPKAYNYTPPVINSYIQSHGAPQRIINAVAPPSSAAQTQPMFTLQIPVAPVNVEGIPINLSLALAPKPVTTTTVTTGISVPTTNVMVAPKLVFQQNPSILALTPTTVNAILAANRNITTNSAVMATDGEAPKANVIIGEPFTDPQMKALNMPNVQKPNTTKTVRLTRIECKKPSEDEEVNGSVLPPIQLPLLDTTSKMQHKSVSKDSSSGGTTQEVTKKPIAFVKYTIPTGCMDLKTVRNLRSFPYDQQINFADGQSHNIRVLPVENGGLSSTPNSPGEVPPHTSATTTTISTSVAPNLLSLPQLFPTPPPETGKNVLGVSGQHLKALANMVYQEGNAKSERVLTEIQCSDSNQPDLHNRHTTALNALVSKLQKRANLDTVAPSKRRCGKRSAPLTCA